MSGPEVLSGISALIAIIDSSVKVWESARKDLRFSATFEAVGNRLPTLRDILQTCHGNFELIKTSLPTATTQGLVKTINDCKRKVERLRTIFQETISGEDDQWHERYRKVVRRLGKGSKVEELTKGITEDAQSLVSYHPDKSASPTLYAKLEDITAEMASLAPSLPADEADTQTFSNYDDGTQNISTGNSTQHIYINRGSGAFYGTAGSATFNQGKD